MAFLRKYGLTWILVGILTAISAYVLKDTEWEDAWLYVFAAGLVLVSILELYMGRRDR